MVSPRFHTRRSPTRPTFGPAVATLAAALGTPFMPWQHQAAAVALEIDPGTGEWAYPTVVLHVPRQAGKTTIILPASLHRCLCVPDSWSWYTAQKRIDARDTFIRQVKQVRRSVLKPPRTKVRESNGSERIEVPMTGSTYGLFSPSDDALHGKANALVTVDEAWTFDEVRGRELLQGILPTFATVAGQLWIISAGGTRASTWLHTYVTRGRAAVAADRRTGLCYIDYGVPDGHEVTVDAVMAAHPAAGHTLRRAAVVQAADEMDASEFARAFGNVWTTTPVYAIDPTRWRAGIGRVPLPDAGAVALAFDVALDGADATIAAAWRRPDTGGVHVEVVAHDRGQLWVPDRMAAAVSRWSPTAIGYDTRGPSPDVADKLARAGHLVIPTGSRDMAAASAAFLADLVADPPRITYTPHEALDAAAAAAARRDIGDAWTWGRRQAAASISPLIAVTLAAWWLDHAPVEPEPERFEIL